MDRRSTFSLAKFSLFKANKMHIVPTHNVTLQQPVVTPELKLLGAVADGKSHILASQFSTLAAAQVVYPHAQSLADEIDWCALQGAIFAAEAQGSGAVQVPNGGSSYILNRGLKVNCNRVTIFGNGSTLDFSRLQGSDKAVWFHADGGNMYGHERHVFQGFELIGPGREIASVAGIYFQTETPALSSRAHIRDCSIQKFNQGILFGDRAYCLGIAHCSVYDCTYAISVPYGLIDAGETISFSQCMFFNSYCAIVNTAGFDLKFLGCSLDYCERILWDNNGIVDFVGCRIEISPPKIVPFHLADGRLNMFGGFFLVTDTENIGPQTATLFDFNRPGASIHFFGVHGWNWRTTSGKLTEGPGKIYWHEGTAITTTPQGIRHP